MNNTLWQSIAAMLLVALAGLFLLWRARRSRKKGCGHACGCSHGTHFDKRH